MREVNADGIGFAHGNWGFEAGKLYSLARFGRNRSVAVLTDVRWEGVTVVMTRLVRSEEIAKTGPHSQGFAYGEFQDTFPHGKPRKGDSTIVTPTANVTVSREKFGHRIVTTHVAMSWDALRLLSACGADLFGRVGEVKERMAVSGIKSEIPLDK